MSQNTFCIRKFIHDYTVLLNQEERSVTARPWNRFRPDDTKWWIVPSTAWPAFGCEKMCFWTEGNYLYGGWNIEKGIVVPKEEQNDESKNILMTSDWKWDEFVNQCGCGLIDRIVDDFNENVSYPVHMIITANIVGNVSGYDPYANKKALRDVIEYAITSDMLKVCDKDLQLGALSAFENIEGITEIPEALSNVAGLNWLWLDVLIYAPIHYIKNRASCRIQKLRDKLLPLENRIFVPDKIKKAENE